MDNELTVTKKLSEKLPEEAIQRTKGSETKKGYDTTGYGYQYAVDRFNEVLGEKWGYDWHIIHEREGQYKNGMPYIELAVQVSIWVNNKENTRSCVGGHTGKDYADALKGAITNGFKKTAAFWGVGRDAFAGTIDDDNQPMPGKAEDKLSTKQIIDAKLKALPEYIQQGMKLMKWNYKQIVDICEMYEWDNDKIKDHIDQATTSPLGKDNLPEGF